MRRLHRPGVIGRAVESVSIVSVLNSLGVYIDAPPQSGTNLRVQCPFGEFHADGGVKREFRVYSDNRAFCHAEQRQYDSVSLYAEAHGCSQYIAAQRLLSGQIVETERQASRSMYAVRAGAVAALAEWAEAHTIDRFSSDYQRCLQLADHISEPEHVMNWLTASKLFLISNGRM